MLCKCGCGQTPKKPDAQHMPGHWARTARAKPILIANGRQWGDRWGEERFNWQGDNPTYSAVHNWLAVHKVRTGICTHCGKKGRTEFANISGEYRRDVDDFVELCTLCHRIMDKEVVDALH